MARNYDNIDLAYSWNGDFAPKAGDLEDTSDDYLRSVLQDVHTVSSSSPGDWELNPGIGSDILGLIGEPNSPTTAAHLHDRLRIGLTSMGIVDEKDLNIRVTPVHIHRMLVIVRIKALATQWNSLAAGETLVTTFVFDSLEQTVTFFEKVPQLIR